MQIREKMLLCAAPYLGAGYLWFALTSPCLVSQKEQSEQLAERKREQIELKAKLFELERLNSVKADLEGELLSLRGSVPKSADMDILLIDLEKMALQCGLDVIGIEPIAREQEKKLEEQEVKELSEPDSPMKTKAAAKTPKAAGARAAEKGPTVVPDLGLNKLTRQITLTGDYAGVVEFMRKLESYQRVITVNQIGAEIPAETSKSKGRDLIITLMVTAYYLP